MPVFRPIPSIIDRYSSRDAQYFKIVGPPICCFKKNCFIKWVNFDWIFKYVPVKLEQIPGNFLKAETISN